MGIVPAQRSSAGFLVSPTNAVPIVAALVFIAGLISVWQLISGNGPSWGFLEAGITAVVIVEVLLSLWAAQTLRRRDLRRIFGD